MIITPFTDREMKPRLREMSLFSQGGRANDDPHETRMLQARSVATLADAPFRGVRS